MVVKTKRFINSTKNCSCSMTGLWRACAYCTGMVVVFHSPKACSHVARRMDLSSYYYSLGSGNDEEQQLVSLVSSQLEEKHSIFGGGERLQDCLRYVTKTYKPECIMVANSCVAGVIGDDVPYLCEEMEQELGLPILTIDCYGFLNGDYYQGYYATAKLLAKHFIKPCAKEKDTVLLLGDNGGLRGEYGQYVTEKMQALGLKVIGQYPSYAAFKDFPSLARAEYMVPMGRPGQQDSGLTDLAQTLAKDLDIKLVANKYPLGLNSSEAWLRAWGELLHKETLAEQIIVQDREMLVKGVQRYLQVSKNKKVVFAMGRLLRYFHPGELLEMLKLLEFDITAIVIIEEAYNAKERQEVKELLSGLIEVPIYEMKDQRVEAALQEAELVITTHELQLGKKKQIFVPMLPKIGVKGLLNFMEVIYRLLCSKISNGGVTYVRN